MRQRCRRYAPQGYHVPRVLERGAGGPRGLGPRRCRGCRGDSWCPAGRARVPSSAGAAQAVSRLTASSGGATRGMGGHRAARTVTMPPRRMPRRRRCPRSSRRASVTSARGGTLVDDSRCARRLPTRGDARRRRQPQAPWMVKNPDPCATLWAHVPPSVPPAQVTVPLSGAAEPARWAAGDIAPGSSAVMRPAGAVAGASSTTGNSPPPAAGSSRPPRHAADLASFDRIVVRASADHPMRDVAAAADAGRWRAPRRARPSISTRRLAR
jgi:hypothetical protein